MTSEPASKEDVQKAQEELAQMTANSFAAVDKRFDQVDTRFDGIDQRLDEIDQRFERVDQRFEQADRRFEGIENRLDTIEDTMATKDQLATVLNVVQSIDQKLDALHDLPERVTRLEEDVAALKLRR